MWRKGWKQGIQWKPNGANPGNTILLNTTCCVSEMVLVTVSVKLETIQGLPSDLCEYHPPNTRGWHNGDVHVALLGAFKEYTN